MKSTIYLGVIVALGLAASPANAQSTSPQPERDKTAMHQDMRTHHDSSDRDRMSMHRDMHHDMSDHDRMSMHRGMSRSHMARWCHSMSHRRMMMNSRCRSMMHMHHHDRMHHM